MMICGNTGVIAGSKLCGLCVAHGCEGYKSYKQKCKNKKQREIMVTINNIKFEEEFRCKHYECPYKCCAYHWNRLDELGQIRYLEDYPIVAEGFPIGIDDVKNCQLYLDI